MVEATVRQRRSQIGSSVAPTDTELADAAFLDAIDRGDRDSALALLKKGQQINVADERGETAVHKATKGGLTAFVAELIKYGAVPDYADVDGVTPIMIAVQFGHAELVAIFISLGERVNFANRTRDGATLLHTGAYYGHEVPHSQPLARIRSPTVSARSLSPSLALVPVRRRSSGRC